MFARLLNPLNFKQNHPFIHIFTSFLLFFKFFSGLFIFPNFAKIKFRFLETVYASFLFVCSFACLASFIHHSSFNPPLLSLLHLSSSSSSSSSFVFLFSFCFRRFCSQILDEKESRVRRPRRNLRRGEINFRFRRSERKEAEGGKREEGREGKGNMICMDGMCKRVRRNRESLSYFILFCFKCI